MWTAEWWPLSGASTVLVSAAGKTWDAKDPQAVCPPDIQALGWGGADRFGRLNWVGWDLDVGHGQQNYKSTDLALSDAFRIRDLCEGNAEIRLSKSGLGVHVRHRLPDDENRLADDGPRIAKAVADKLSVRADRSALGRQAFWFWTHETNIDSFRLIHPHKGMEWSS